MENFLYNDNFFTDLGQLIEYLEIDDDEIVDLKDDWSVNITLTTLEPLFEVTAEKMLELFLDANEDRLGEDFDEKHDIHERLLNLFKENCDFEKIKAGIPELYYPSNQGLEVTKKDLMEYCNIK